MKYNIKENLNDSALVQWLVKDDLKELFNLIKVKGVRGSAVERKIAQDLNSQFTDLHGSDEIDSKGRIIETKTTKSPVTESMIGGASKAAGVAPTKKPILEVNDQFARWQMLAGIKK